MVNAQSYEAHAVEPDMTSLGSGRGIYPLPGDQNTYWNLPIFKDGEYLGEGAGLAMQKPGPVD
jgi:hypothetical protein